MDEREQLLSELESHLERFWSLYGITDDDVKKELLSAQTILDNNIGT